MATSERRCRECACTEQNGCIVSAWDPVNLIHVMTCWWVEPDLCSGCAYGITVRGPMAAALAAGEGDGTA